jgi:hypothetical protein
MKPISISKQYVGFDATGFPDLLDGNYGLLLKLPSSLEGAYISVRAVAERLFTFTEPLPDAIVTSFETRDTNSSALPHDWKRVDYSENASPINEKVALTETLRYMEEARDVFHLTANEINPFTKLKPVKSLLNAVSLETISDCLSNSAPHWSDLTLHYYCVFSELRRCYTGAIKETGPAMETVKIEELAKGLTGETFTSAMTCRLPTMPAGLNLAETPLSLPTETTRTHPVVPLDPTGRFPTLRNYAYFMCALPESLALPRNTSPANNAFPGCLARKDIFAYAPDANHRKNFGWLTSDAKRATMFRYMMDAPTFAFDDQDQQDVINAFWRVTNPSDPKDCAKRPLRALDPRDGTHCLPNARVAEAGKKVQRPLQLPAGR